MGTGRLPCRRQTQRLVRAGLGRLCSERSRNSLINAASVTETSECRPATLDTGPCQDRKASPQRHLMPWEVRRRRVPSLLAAVCCLLLGPAHGDPSSNPDINVHRVLLYRNGGLEDSDQARSKRNVLVRAHLKPHALRQQ